MACDCREAEFKRIESERDALKAEVEKLKQTYHVFVPSESYDQLLADRDRWKKLAGELAKALRAQIQMRDSVHPKKLDEHLCWVEDDDLANRWATDVLAAYDSVERGKGL